MDFGILLLQSAVYANGVESQSTGSRGFASAPCVDRNSSFCTPTALHRLSRVGIDLAAVDVTPLA